jgi:GNAT superfamily N-acetyltransferase
MSGELTIRQVDPFDDATFDAWHDAYYRAERHGREDHATSWTLPELRISMQEPSRSRRRTGWIGEVDGEAVTTGFAALPLLDSLDHAELAVDTVPEHRRRGYASAMLAVVEQAVRAEGRTVLNGEVAWAHELGSTGEGSPGLEFALARGYRLGLGDVLRELTLPLPDGLLAELAAEAARYHPAYSLRSWVGPVPDDLVHGWAELSSTLMTEAPTGDLVREQEAVDIEALREGEAVTRKQGRTKFNTVALDAGGAVVAYTDIATTVHEPGRAYQWGTLVRRDHRGYRLGMAVKVANLALLQRESPFTRHVLTWNAEVNAHMIGVNERLGFVPVERSGELQKHLG